MHFLQRNSKNIMKWHQWLCIVVVVGDQKGAHVLSCLPEERLRCSLQQRGDHCLSRGQLQQTAGKKKNKKKEPHDWMIKCCLSSLYVMSGCFFLMCQVRDGRTGSVLFQTEEMSSRIRCTCLCKQPFAVALGQEDGTVQVKTCWCRHQLPHVLVCHMRDVYNESIIN